MKKRFSKIVLMVLVLQLLTQSFAAGASVFSDVDATTPQGKAIESLNVYKVISGKNDGTFQPNATITRAEFATMIYYLCNDARPVDDSSRAYYAEKSKKYADVSADAWYKPYVDFCTMENIVSGTETNTFSPEDPVTMEQAVKMCYSAIAIHDVKMDSYAYPQGYIDAARSAGYLQDIAGFSPKATATRGMVAQLCYNGVWSGKEVWKSSTPAGSVVKGFELHIPPYYGIEQERNMVMAPGFPALSVVVNVDPSVKDAQFKWVPTGWVADEDPVDNNRPDSLMQMDVRSFKKINDTQYEAIVDFPLELSWAHGMFAGKFIVTVDGKTFDSATYNFAVRGGGGV